MRTIFSFMDEDQNMHKKPAKNANYEREVILMNQ